MTSLAMADHLFDGDKDLDGASIGLESAYQNAVDRLLINSTGITGQVLSGNTKRYLPSSFNFAPISTAEMQMDILSAASYPAPLPLEAHSASRGGRQYYGGIVLNDQDEQDLPMASTGQEDASAKKKVKKARRGSEDNESKKQRGRPRLDTRDETAADRRRTQIRLAQRAYRLRKETTISALKKRVTELEGTIEEMNKSFLKFNDNAISSGLLRSKPELAQQLKGTTEHFLSLARVADSDSDQDDDAMEDLQEDDAPNDEQRWPEPLATKREEKGPRKSSAPTRIEQPLGYELTYDDNENRSRQSRSSSTELRARPNGTNWPGTIQQFHVQIPDVNVTAIPDLFSSQSIERPLKPSGPYTYSFQEKTFARRLHRACLERAFRLLTNPTSSQEELSKAFRFTFCFSSKKRMLARFQELLKRTANDSLENWNVPYFHVGGAGLHFPRHDEDGNPSYPPNMHPPSKAFGPSPLVIAETPRGEENVAKMLEAIGFGGEWFDAHDVEEYLKSKGVVLDGHSSFVDIDPSVPLLIGRTSSADASSSDTDATPESPLRTPASPSNQAGTVDIHRAVRMNNDDNFSNTLPLPFPVDEFYDLGGKVLDYSSAVQELPLQHADYGSSEGNYNRQSVTVDVEKLLKQMVNQAVCLGRAPGFRRRDVDTALGQALQEAF